MKITLAQMNPTVGDLENNKQAILRAAEQSVKDGADLLLCPELAICGYPPWDLLERPAFIERCASIQDELVAALPSGLTVVFGNVRRRPIPPTYGRALQNVAVVAKDGKVHCVAKTLLPTYDVFDEARYFEPAPDKQTALFEVAGRKVGVTICEDLWNDDELWAKADLWRDKTPGNHRLYERDPMAELAAQGAEVIVNLSASPWAQGKLTARKTVVQNAAEKHGVWLAYCNLAGANDGLIFDGSSMLVDPKGQIRRELPCFEECNTTVSFEDSLSVVEPRERIVKIRDALSLGIRDYFKKTGLKRCVLGLSGGIDSAVTAYLAAHALGPENVIGVAMPSKYSSDHSLADAEALAKNLGIARYETVSIQSPFDALLAGLAEPFAGLEPDVTEENLQARLRGTILMGFANKLNAVVLCTGNKSEAAMGYCTLYGDTIGALAVLADCYKNQVYALAELCNRDAGRDVIPRSSIDKPPSAELRPDQKDEDSLPPYDLLDRMLELFLEHRWTAEAIAEELNIEVELSRSIIKTVYFNEFKRRQMPPTLRVSRKAWVGRIYPIAQRFRE